MGRPVKIINRALPVYDSLAECAAAAKIPIEILKAAKRDGCPFVLNGRPHLAEFIQWFFQRTEGQLDKENWSRRSKRAEALTREFALQVKQGQVVDRALTTRFLRFMSAAWKEDYDRQAQEYPALLKGCDEDAIFKEVKRQQKIARAFMESKLQEWEHQKPE